MPPQQNIVGAFFICGALCRGFHRGVAFRLLPVVDIPCRSRQPHQTRFLTVLLDVGRFILPHP